jgi:hypothetical protein
MSPINKISYLLRILILSKRMSWENRTVFTKSPFRLDSSTMRKTGTKYQQFHIWITTFSSILRYWVEPEIQWPVSPFGTDILIMTETWWTLIERLGTCVVLKWLLWGQCNVKWALGHDSIPHTHFTGFLYGVNLTDGFLMFVSVREYYSTQIPQLWRIDHIQNIQVFLTSMDVQKPTRSSTLKASW